MLKLRSKQILDLSFRTKFSQIIPYLLFAIVLLCIALWVPRFFHPRNIKNILVQASTLGLMAIGMTGVFIVGGMDLSIPSVMAVSGILGAVVIREGAPPVAGIAMTIAAGVGAGFVNGASVAFLRMIPFVVTLAMMQVMMGVATWVTNSVSVAVPLSYINGMLFKFADLPLPVYIFIILTILATFFYKRTMYGRWLYMVGANIKTAAVCGIPTTKVVFLTYAVSGLFAGLTGLLLTARLGGAGPLMGTSNVVLDVMSASVVGGVSIYGGVGSPLGAAFGALVITILNNILNLLRIDFFPAQVIKGVIVIAFVALDSMRRKGRTA